MLRLLFALLLVSSASAQVIEAEPAAEEKPSVSIDLKTGTITEVMSAERTWLTTPNEGTLVVDPPAEGLATMEPVLVEGMFQGWREKVRGPTLSVTGFPTDGDRMAPIVVSNGEPGGFAKVNLSTPNLSASSRDFTAFPLIPFDVDGKVSFKIQASDSQPWIVHVSYRAHTVEIRGQWSALKDF